MTFGKESKKSRVKGSDSELLSSKAINSQASNEHPTKPDSKTDPEALEPLPTAPLKLENISKDELKASKKKPYVNESNDLFRLLLEQAPKPKEASPTQNHLQNGNTECRQNQQKTQYGQSNPHLIERLPKDSRFSLASSRSKSRPRVAITPIDHSASNTPVKKPSKTPTDTQFHERLFYRGIEAIKKKEEKAELEFSIRYPFKPNVQPSLNLTRISDVKVNQLTYEYKTKEMNLKQKRLLADNVDPKDGRPLYSPRITTKSPIQHKRTLDQIEAEERTKRSFVNNLKQIFDFLDKGYEGVIYASKIDYENLHPQLARLLNQVIYLVIKADSPLSFAQFYHLVIDNGLSHHVQDIFDQIGQEPFINPKKLKEAPFK